MSYLIKYATSFCVTKFPSRYLRPTLMFIDPLPVIRPNSILDAEFIELFRRAILEFYHRFKIGIADFTFFFEVMMAVFTVLSHCQTLSAAQVSISIHRKFRKSVEEKLSQENIKYQYRYLQVIILILSFQSYLCTYLRNFI